MTTANTREALVMIEWRGLGENSPLCVQAMRLVPRRRDGYSKLPTLAFRTFRSDTRIVKGTEFLRKDELKSGTYHAMLKQLGITDRDFRE